jgi:diguanylate cyclase (GGDEF)-like protein
MTLGGRESSIVRLEEAVAAFREALKENTRERAPLQWANTQNSLGIALERIGERESGTARLEEAVAAYHDALTIYTRERNPLQWVATGNQAVALMQIARDLMTKLEGDLGTKLDWVAVNHFNTGHPHVHVIINGRDELGEDLVINGDYIAHGIRERASELVTLELGPVTEIEQRRKLAAEIDQDRFTRIDRALIAEAGDGLVDLRHAPADPRGISDRALRLARLGKLERMGLASEPAPGRWQLSEKLEPTLRELGERGDIIKTMHKALGADGLQRDPASFWIHDGAPSAPIVGRVIDKHLSDELGENLTLIIDGVDGRTHHVPGIDPAGVEDISIGSIVEVGSAKAGRRPADRAIADVAEEGVYRPSRHLEQARFGSSVGILVRSSELPPSRGVNADDLPRVQQTVAALKLGEAEEARIIYRTRHREKREIWIESALRVTRIAGTGEIDGVVAISRDMTEHKDLENKLAALATSDGLTGLANRRHFDERLQEEWARAKRDGTPLSLLLIDVDHFKKFNDQYGHQAGDACLRSLARVLADQAQRPADLAARYGGEEFVLLLPNTDAEGCEQVGQKVREALREFGMLHPLNPPSKRVTLSLGGATNLPASGTSLIEAADRALYTKDSGRDRLVMSGQVIAWPGAKSA